MSIERDKSMINEAEANKQITEIMDAQNINFAKAFFAADDNGNRIGTFFTSEGLVRRAKAAPGQTIWLMRGGRLCSLVYHGNDQFEIKQSQD